MPDDFLDGVFQQDAKPAATSKAGPASGDFLDDVFAGASPEPAPAVTQEPKKEKDLLAGLSPSEMTAIRKQFPDASPDELNEMARGMAEAFTGIGSVPTLRARGVKQSDKAFTDPLSFINTKEQREAVVSPGPVLVQNESEKALVEGARVQGGIKGGAVVDVTSDDDLAVLVKRSQADKALGLDFISDLNPGLRKEVQKAMAGKEFDKGRVSALADDSRETLKLEAEIEEESFAQREGELNRTDILTRLMTFGLFSADSLATLVGNKELAADFQKAASREDLGTGVLRMGADAGGLAPTIAKTAQGARAVLMKNGVEAVKAGQIARSISLPFLIGVKTPGDLGERLKAAGTTTALIGLAHPMARAWSSHLTSLPAWARPIMGEALGFAGADLLLAQGEGALTGAKFEEIFDPKRMAKSGILGMAFGAVKSRQLGREVKIQEAMRMWRAEMARIEKVKTEFAAELKGRVSVPRLMSGIGKAETVAGAVPLEPGPNTARGTTVSLPPGLPEGTIARPGGPKGKPPPPPPNVINTPGALQRTLQRPFSIGEIKHLNKQGVPTASPMELPPNRPPPVEAKRAREEPFNPMRREVSVRLLEGNDAGAAKIVNAEPDTAIRTAPYAAARVSKQAQRGAAFLPGRENAILDLAKTGVSWVAQMNTRLKMRAGKTGDRNLKEASVVVDRAMEDMPSFRGMMSDEFNHARKMAGRFRGSTSASRLRRVPGTDAYESSIVESPGKGLGVHPDVSPKSRARVQETADALQALISKGGQMDVALGVQVLTDKGPRPFRNPKGVMPRFNRPQFRKLIMESDTNPARRKMIRETARGNQARGHKTWTEEKIKKVYDEMRSAGDTGSGSVESVMAAERARQIPYRPHGIHHHGRVMELMTSNPYEYATAYGSRVPARQAVIKHGGQILGEGTSRLEKISAGVTGVKDRAILEQTMRAVHQQGVERSWLSPSEAEPFHQMSGRALRNTKSLLKAGLLSGSAAVNVPEIFGIPRQFAGTHRILLAGGKTFGAQMQNLGSWLTRGKIPHNMTLDALARNGAITEDRINMSVDFQKPLTGVIRKITEVSSRAHGFRLINEHQESSTALGSEMFMSALQSGYRGKAHEFFSFGRNVERLTGANVPRQLAIKVASGRGTPEEMQRVSDMAPSLKVAANLQAVQRSRLEHNAIFAVNTVFPMFSQNVLRDVGRHLTSIAKAVDVAAGVTPSGRGIAKNLTRNQRFSMAFGAARGFASYWGGKAAQGTAQFLVVSRFFGGEEGFDNSIRAMKEDFWGFAKDSVVYTTFGGPMAQWVRFMEGDLAPENLSFPLWATIEAVNAVGGSGRYENLAFGDRMDKFFNRTYPIKRSVEYGLIGEIIGNPKQAQVGAAAVRGYYDWARFQIEKKGRRDLADLIPPEVTRRTDKPVNVKDGGEISKDRNLQGRAADEIKAIRRFANHGYRALQRGDIEGLEREVDRALDMPTSFDEKNRKAILRSHLRNRMKLSKIDLDDQESLRKRIGDRQFQFLEQVDTELERIAQTIK